MGYCKLPLADEMQPFLDEEMRDAQQGNQVCFKLVSDSDFVDQMLMAGGFRHNQ